MIWCPRGKRAWRQSESEINKLFRLAKWKKQPAKAASEWRRAPMNGQQDVFWSGWSESQLQPERWPGPGGRACGQGEAVPRRLRGAVRGAGLYHDFRLPQQLYRAAAVLQIQEAADAGEHAAAEHQCERHAGVFVRHHAELCLQYPREVAAGAQRLQLVRLHQLLLRWVGREIPCTMQMHIKVIRPK